MSSTPSLETVLLRDDASSAAGPGSDARVVVAPARGGMVTRFDIGHRHVLFLDEATLADSTKNVRGGIPVLFPSPGPLTRDRFVRGGRSGSMKQHGFARQQAWSVVARSEREVTLELTSNDATRAQFPWELVARIRYALAATTLTIETTIESRDDRSLPFALGFHPYFHVLDADKSRTVVETDATRAFDNVTKTTVDLAGHIDLTRAEVDLHLVDHTPRSATLHRSEHDRIVVSGDPDYRRWVVWTLAGKDFVCLEPWTASADALNSGEHLLELRPGESKTLTMTIEAQERPG